MRFIYVVLLSLASVASLHAQMEPCLAGLDRPDCGIKIVVNPPPESSDTNVIWAPSAITIDVPLRMHPTKIQLDAGTNAADVSTFKLIAQNGHFKKAGTLARFQMEIKSCPERDSLLVFNILSPRLPYPLAANPKLLECKEKANR